MPRWKDRTGCHITLDPSLLNIVIVCTCGYRAIASTPNEAWTMGAEHQRRSEDGTNAIDAIGKRRERGLL